MKHKNHICKYHPSPFKSTTEYVSADVRIGESGRRNVYSGLMTARLSL